MSKKKLQLNILTPLGIIFDQEVDQVMEEADDSMGIDYSNLQEVMSKELNRVRLGQKGMRK
jgi:hypothetical protein